SPWRSRCTRSSPRRTGRRWSGSGPRAAAAPAARRPAAREGSRARGPSRTPFRSGSSAGSGPSRTVAAERDLPSGGLEERGELARALELIKVVAASDVEAVDPDLRHRAPAAFLDHLGAPRGLEIDANLLDRDALLLQQPVG